MPASPPTAISTNALLDELNRRRRIVRALERRRDKVAARIANLDAQILAAGGRPGRPGSHRRLNAVTLRDALAAALKGKKMGVTEAAQTVVRAGYQSVSPNFMKMVQAQLLDKKRFKRMGRGVYAGR